MDLPAQIVKGLYPYQRAGVEHLCAGPRRFLADDMGLGKTLQCIRAADAQGLRRVLAVVPAVARVNTAREWQRWQTVLRAIHVVTDGKTPIPADAEVVVINYDLLFKRRVELSTRRWDVLILDEVQALKSLTSKRTQAVIEEGGIASAAARVWPMTGTPVPNHYGELFVVARHLIPEIADSLGIRSYSRWLARFCVTRETDYGLQVVANRNGPELTAALRPYMIRRRKAQVLKDLPRLTITQHVVEADPALLKRVKTERRSEFELMSALLEEARTGEAVLEEAVALASVRRLIGVLKAPGVATLACDLLEGDSDSKVLIFAQHRSVMDVLENELREFGVVTINGSTPSAARIRAIDSFQGNKLTRVFIGQIQACNSAINLQAANRVIMAESSWTPAENEQCIARAHRLGNTRPVTAIFASLAGSIDEAVTNVLMRKMADIRKLFDE